MEISPCIFWTKAKDTAGYGVSWKNGKWIRAHRKVWIETYGDIPNGLNVCHTCDNRPCINPLHLFLGTSKENSKDMVIKNRQIKGVMSHFAKLSEFEVLEIRKSLLSSRKTAKLYNISKTNVLDIKNKKIWKHI